MTSYKSRPFYKKIIDSLFVITILAFVFRQNGGIYLLLEYVKKVQKPKRINKRTRHSIVCG